ncbi:MAG: hypothetical protein J0H99_06915, partial [Rhodospirillales bacterium]|nr:hypothetical protein [Rhodospirillales bacterium]
GQSVNATLERSGGISTGGTVNVTLQPGATITTQGVNAYGILAQSVGGGGGIIIAGGSSGVTAANVFSGLPGSSANATSDGGAVTVSTGAGSSIVTTGAGAVGILAQSVGAGGGIVNGMAGATLGSAPQSTDYNAWGLGQGNRIVVDSSSNITTTGANAHGIYASTISGSGGVIGHADGSGYSFSGQGQDWCLGNCPPLAWVSANVNAGTIRVSGAGASGVYSESWGGELSAAYVTVASGASVISTGASSAAVTIATWGDGLLTNNGVIDGSGNASQAAVNVIAPNASKFSVSLQNSGQISGSINGAPGSGLGGAANIVLANLPSGTLNAGPQINLGAGRLANDGSLSIGYGRAISATTLTGTLLQSPTGRLVVDTDHAAKRADMLVVQGSAQLAGTIEARPVTLSRAPVTVLSATGGVSLAPSATGHRSYAFNLQPLSDGTNIRIQPSADFTGMGGLNAQQREVATHLQQLWNNGESLGTGFAALSGIQDAGSYNRAMDTLSGQTLGAIAAWRYVSSMNFVNNMQSCPIFVGDSMAMRESACAWGRVTGNSTSQNALHG